MIDSKVLDQLTKLGNSISSIRNEIMKVSSYSMFLNIRTNLNLKLNNIDIELKGMINNIVVLNEKVEEYQRLLEKYENMFVNSNSKMNNNILNKLIDNLNSNNVDAIDNSKFNQTNQYKYDRSQLHFNYDEYLPMKYTNYNTASSPKYKSNLLTPPTSNCSWKDKNKEKLNMNYNFSLIKNIINDNDKENKSLQNTKVEVYQLPSLSKNVNCNQKEKDKITRIQDIILQAYKSEAALQSLESQFGKEFSTLITSKDISLDFISSVESVLLSMKPPNS